MSRVEAAEAYLGVCNRLPDEDCVLWDGRVDEQGYGLIYGDPRTYRAHVAAYLDSGRGVPRGWHVHHRCETKLCVKAEHLVALSPREHAREHAPEAVRTVRHVRLLKGISLKQLSAMTGIEPANLSRIERGIQVSTRDEVRRISIALGARFWWSALLVDVTEEQDEAPWKEFFGVEEE